MRGRVVRAPLLFFIFVGRWVELRGSWCKLLLAAAS